MSVARESAHNINVVFKSPSVLWEADEEIHEAWEFVPYHFDGQLMKHPRGPCHGEQGAVVRILTDASHDFQDAQSGMHIGSDGSASEQPNLRPKLA